MSRTTRVASIVYLLLLWSVATSARCQPGPATEAGAINQDLAKTYSGILASDQVGNPVDADNIKATLTSDLTRLYYVDAGIKALGPGFGDPSIDAAAQRFRALAWLHGWAIFSRLIIESQRLDRNPAFRTNLFGANEPAPPTSALALLLSIYSQMQKREGSDEPLQHLLRDGTDLVFELSYQEAWRGDKPADITHAYYIPSSDELFGEPQDSPVLDRHILSLWSVINSALDNWQAFQTQKVRPDSPDKPPAPGAMKANSEPNLWIEANTTNFGSLSQWLDNLQHDQNLPSFGARRDLLVSRLYKINLYLKARQDLADPANLKTIIHDLADSRLQGSSPQTVPAIGELLEAATPLQLPGGQQESLYDAAIWLRYVLLLSYQHEGASIAMGTAPNGLDAIWNSLHLTSPFVLLRPKSSPAPTALASNGNSSSVPYLRWNTWPASGTFTSVLADLTTAAYDSLKFDSDQATSDSLRFSSIDSSASRVDYAKTLATNLALLTKGAVPVLQPYYQAAVHQTPSQKSTPTRLTLHSGAWFLPFHSTATDAEQARIIFDLAMLNQHLTQTTALNSLVLSAYQTGDASSLAISLKTMGGTTSLSNWNIYALPTKSFAEYSSKLQNAATRLSQAVNQIASNQEVREVFNERRATYQAARNSLESARLGAEVAAKAQVISQTYAKIAQLDDQIQQVDEKIQKLSYQGDLSDQQAKRLSLTYAVQKQQLAAAKVQALLLATDQATELVGKASVQLQGIKEQLLSTATAIHDSKEAARNKSLINAVITVVGVVLAPFTGGASLGIALMATQVVNTIDTVSHTNWSNFGDAIATVGQIANQTNKVLTLTGNLAPPDVQQAIGDLNHFFDSTKQLITTYSPQVQTLYAAIKALPNKEDAARFAAAVASGLPLSFDQASQTLHLDLDPNQLIPQNPALQSSLAALLDSGVILTNTAQLRAADFSNLPSLSGQDLKAALAKALDDSVVALPVDLASTPPVGDIAAKLVSARAGLQTTIQGLSDADSQMLAEALAGGAVFVRDSAADKVTAIQGQIAPELQQFKARIVAFQNDVAKAAVQKVLTTINATTDDINKTAQQYIDKNDDEGLATYAKTVLPQRIDSLKTGLDSLKNQVEAARGDLADKKTEVSIASYEAQSSEFVVEAGAASVQEAAIKGQRVGAENDAALADVERAKLVVKKGDYSIQAEQNQLQAAAISLRGTYFECLARGFNPLANPDGTATDQFFKGYDQFDGTSLLGLVIGQAGAAPLGQQVLIREEADAVAGMAQWVNLLRIPLNGAVGGDALAVYTKLIKILQNLDLATKQDGESLRNIGSGFEDQYQGVTATNLGVKVTQFDKVSGTSDILWFDQLQPEEGMYWKNLAPKNVRSEVVAMVTLRFEVNAGNYDNLVFRPAEPTADRINYAYYMNTTNTLVSTSPGSEVNSSQLNYVIVPPQNSMSNANQATVGVDPPIVQDPSQFRSADEALWTQSLQDDVIKWRAISLSGAVGTWRLYFWSSSTLNAAQIADLRSKLVLSVRIPYYRVAVH